MSQPVTDPPAVTDPGTTEPVVTEPVVTPPADPPYKAELDQFPESLRPIAEKTFKEWDAKVQEQFKQYAPWKDVVESATPDSVSNALALAQYMEQNPQGLVDALIQSYGLTKPEAQAVVAATTPEPPAPDPDLENLPPSVLAKLAEVDTMKEALSTIATYLQGNEQASQAQYAQTVLDNTLAAAKTKYGDFDEDYVVTKLASNGGDIDAAVAAYRKIVPATAPVVPAPTVVGGGGGVPVGEQANLASLSDRDTRKLVESVLAKAAAEG